MERSVSVWVMSLSQTESWGFRHVSVMSQVRKRKMNRVRIVTLLTHRIASNVIASALAHPSGIKYGATSELWLLSPIPLELEESNRYRFFICIWSELNRYSATQRRKHLHGVLLCSKSGSKSAARLNRSMSSLSTMMGFYHYHRWTENYATLHISVGIYYGHQTHRQH